MPKSHSLTCGINLKPAHFEQALLCQDPGLWFEVHTENYFMSGGPRLDHLDQIKDKFPLSLHGVGASLGGPELPDPEHLKKVKRLVEHIQPTLISEHAVWSRLGPKYFAELLPLPRTQEALQRLTDGVNAYQNAINQRILIENPTNYLSFRSDMDEPDFLLEVCQKTGCGLLLDVNNLHISEHNCGVSASDYIRRIPADMVGEIHIAGFDQDPNHGEHLLLDGHGSPVDTAVWQLLKTALSHLGPKPVLLERDANLPTFDALRQERTIAHDILIAC